MGRVKLKIKRLENINGRQATYAKRKSGIMKKANELSILCDIDIVLLMFSPSGKPSLCNGKGSSIEEVIAKFAQLTPQERAKRKLESLEVLKKTFKKLDHDVNIQDFLGTSSQTIEELTTKARLLQTQLSEVHKRLSYWTDLEKINSIEELGQMEDSLRESLDQVLTHKENIDKQQLASLEVTSQFQNGMHLPFTIGAEQQLQSISWTPNNDSQHIVLAEEPNLLLQRDMDCPGGSSFGSYPGYFGTGRKSEIDISGQESVIPNELNRNASMSLQLGGQCPYPQYNLNFLSEMKFQSAEEMTQQENYHPGRIFETPRTAHDTTHCSWASTSGSCAVAMVDERLYSQQIN